VSEGRVGTCGFRLKSRSRGAVIHIPELKWSWIHRFN